MFFFSLLFFELLDENFFKNLDSSIKKIPPFIKKLNTILKVENESQLINELTKVPAISISFTACLHFDFDFGL